MNWTTPDFEEISAGAYEVISQLTEISSKSGVVQFM